MKIGRWVAFPFLLWSCFTIESQAAPLEVRNATAAHNLNNELDKCDFKIDTQEFLEDWDELGVHVDIDETVGSEDVKRDLTDVNTGIDSYAVAAKSFLIEQGVVERPIIIEWGELGYEAGFDDSWYSDDKALLKSDLYVMLYRMRFGAEKGRTLVLENASVREGKIVSGETEGIVYNGDYYFYYPGSVYELYLEKLLDKGLLLKSDLDPDNPFITEYEKNSEDNRPAWYSSNGTADIGYLNALGQTYSFTKNSIKRNAPTFFGDAEEMTMLDALQVIEKFVRLTEKDMTQSEADIIMYKYGVSYLNGLEDDEANTVSFLVAKGILNFENDPMDFFGEVTYRDIYPILYRVSKEDARYNFSEIQLSDAEAFWQSEGFGLEDFTLTITDETFIMDTVSVEEKTSAALASLWRVHAADKVKTYSVTKDFDTVNSFMYKGENVKNILSLALADRAAKYPEILEIFHKTESDIEVIRVVFKVEASSAVRALQLLDSKIDYRVKDAVEYTMSAVTKIEKDGTEVRMISQEALRRCFATVDIVEDKVLRNRDNGMMACLLQDSGYALVGNQVFSKRHILITDTKNDIYYNLDVIASLVGVQITNVYTKSVGTSKVAKTPNVEMAPVRVSQDLSAGSIEYLVMEDSHDSLVEGTNGGSNPVYLYNVNQLSNGVNTLMRHFSVDLNGDGKKEKMLVIVDWVYAVPDLDSFNKDEWISSTAKNTSLTLNGIFNALYTEPSNGELQNWWRSNLGMSNALANFIFGTSRVEYVKCGYLAPKLTVLLPEGTTKDISSLNNLSGIFCENGFSMPESYKKWIGGSTVDFLTSYFIHSAGFKEGGVSYGFAQANRGCQVIIGSGTADSGETFGTSYFLQDNGVLFRNLDDDSRRLSYESEENKVTKIVIRDRTGGESFAPDGTKLDYKGKKWYYWGSATLGDSSYLKLTLMSEADDLPQFSYSTKNNKYQYVGSHSSEATHLMSLYTRWFSRAESDIMSDVNLQREIFGANRENTFSLNKETMDYASNGVKYGLSYRGETGVFQKSYTGTGWYSVTVKDGTKVTTMPTLYLPAGSYYLYYSQREGGYALGEGAVGGALNTSYLYYSGIVDGVIDSILAAQLETTELGKLQDGTKLIVDDVTLTKKGDYWVTVPVMNNEAVALAKNDNCMAAAYRLWVSTAIRCDGLTIPFQNYLKEAALGNTGLDLVPADAGCLTINKSGNMSVYQNGEYLEADTQASYVVLRVKLDDSLLVRKLSSDGSLYGICYRATESIANGTDYPFFSENLSFSTSQQDFITLSQSSYEMTATYNAQKDAFEAVYQKKWYTDFWTLLKMVIICIASYLSIMGWMVYFTVTMGYGLRFLEALAGRGRDGLTHGIDLVKLFSLSVYSLDNPPQLSRVMVVTFVCFVVDAIALSML